MTAPKRVSIKLYIENPQDVQIEAIVPVFHSWIQQHTVEGMLIDVADYKHVFNGPSIILIAHEGDYTYTLSEGRPGISYTLKVSDAETLPDALGLALRRAVDAAEKLQSASGLNGIRLNFREIQSAIGDRLHYPNQADVVAAVQEKLQSLATVLSDDVSVQAIAEDNRNLITFVMSSTTDINSESVSRLSVAQVG
jgi:hypothetical protein